MELIDIGCNLTHDSFDVDRKEVIEAAFQAGVCQMIVTGASAEGSQDALQLARQWPQQSCTQPLACTRTGPPPTMPKPTALLRESGH